MQTNSTRARLELEAEAHRVLAMEMHALFSYLDDEELEEFCAEFVSALDLCFAFAAAREIAAERGEKLARLRSAFDFGDRKAALDIAREFCGIKHHAKSNRTNRVSTENQAPTTAPAFRRTAP
jgi:hypothetical protein